jgi:hypothetical protein
MHKIPFQPHRKQIMPPLKMSNRLMLFEKKMFVSYNKNEGKGKANFVTGRVEAHWVVRRRSSHIF